MIRYDGLAFVPDTIIYGKCRLAQLKDFVAFKKLPRAKPRISAAGDNPNQATGSSDQQKTANTQTDRAQTSTTPKPSTSSSSKRQPPKNNEEITRQSLNRKALGPQRKFKTTTTTETKKPQPTRQKLSFIKTQNLPVAKEKAVQRKYHVECETTISLSSDDSDLHRHRESQQPNEWT